jgi:hypothetical protein
MVLLWSNLELIDLIVTLAVSILSDCVFTLESFLLLFYFILFFINGILLLLFYPTFVCRGKGE